MSNAVYKTNYQALVPRPSQPHYVIRDAPKRMIVVGDVHGCLEELQNLLQECNFNRNEGDEVLLVGDLVNKGPFSAETVKFVRENDFYCIRGNHDDFALCHALKLVAKSDSPSLQYIEKFSQEDIEWLTNLPYSISIPAWRTIFVHAGIVPTQSLTSQSTTNLVTMRNVIEDALTNLTGTDKAEEGEPWVSRWEGHLVDAQHTIDGGDEDLAQNWQVVFGHDAKRGLQQAPFATGLDTGCSYGKQLTGLILPERRLVQVQAKEVYTPISEKD